MPSYAISDIHGCFDELQELLSLIGFSDSDELYILGDLIDRGPKNDECIKWITSTGDNVHYILGNHEQMMSWTFEGQWSKFKTHRDSKEAWFRNGGEKTYEQCKRMRRPDVMDKFQEMVANASLVASAHVGEHFPVLVHAGLRPPEDLSDPQEWSNQATGDLLWITQDWYESRAEVPFDTVFGHTSTRHIAYFLQDLGLCPESQLVEGSLGHVMNWNRKWAIDCGCVFGGNLAALRLEDREAFYVPCQKPGGYR